MIQAIGLVLIAILAENMVLVRCMGMGWPESATSSEGVAWRMGVSITLVMLFNAMAAVWETRTGYAVRKARCVILHTKNCRNTGFANLKRGFRGLRMYLSW